MIIVVLLLIFSCVIVLIGGNNPDVSQLYYDSDFSELYTVKEEESGERKFKGGRRIGSTNKNEDVPEKEVAEAKDKADNLTTAKTEITPSKKDISKSKSKVDLSKDAPDKPKVSLTKDESASEAESVVSANDIYDMIDL